MIDIQSTSADIISLDDLEQNDVNTLYELFSELKETSSLYFAISTNLLRSISDDLNSTVTICVKQGDYSKLTAVKKQIPFIEYLVSKINGKYLIIKK